MKATTVAIPEVSQKSKPSLTASSLASDLEARTVRTPDGRYIFPTGKGLLTIERQRIAAAIAELRSKILDRLPGNGGPDVREAVEMLYASFKVRDISQSRQEFFEAFAVALGGQCRPAMFEAGRRLVRAEAPPEYSRTFLPSTAELVALIKAIEQGWRTDIARLEHLLGMAEARPALTERQPSAEEVAAARARFDKMAAGARKVPAGASELSSGVSPAARVAAETAARKSAKLAKEGGDGDG